MKFTKKLIIILSVVVLFSACKTTGRVKVEDFKVSMNSPHSKIGEVELQMETLMGMGKLKKQTADVLYYPREDAVCIKYKYEFYNYNQFWDKKGRLLFINALQKYNDDYSARDLQAKSNKSQQKYGTVRGYLVWQQFSFTVQAFANMNVDLGYTFKEKSPYFTIYQRETEYIDKNARDHNRTSPNVTLYFTRAQAAELSAIFEQHVLADDNLQDDYESEDYEEADTPVKESDVPKDEY